MLKLWDFFYKIDTFNSEICTSGAPASLFSKTFLNFTLLGQKGGWRMKLSWKSKVGTFRIH